MESEAKYFTVAKLKWLSPHAERMRLAVRPRGETLEIMRAYAKKVREHVGTSESQEGVEKLSGGADGQSGGFVG